MSTIYSVVIGVWMLMPSLVWGQSEKQWQVFGDNYNDRENLTDADFAVLAWVVRQVFPWRYTTVEPSITCDTPLLQSLEGGDSGTDRNREMALVQFSRLAIAEFTGFAGRHTEETTALLEAVQTERVQPSVSFHVQSFAILHYYRSNEMLRMRAAAAQALKRSAQQIVDQMDSTAFGSLLSVLQQGVRFSDGFGVEACLEVYKLIADRLFEGATELGEEDYEALIAGRERAARNTSRVEADSKFNPLIEMMAGCAGAF